MARAKEECTDSTAANSKAHMKSQPQIKLISFHHQKTPKEGRVQRAMLKQESVIYISSRPSTGEFGPSSINYQFMPLIGISGLMICKTKSRVEIHAIAQCSYVLTNRFSLCPKFSGPNYSINQNIVNRLAGLYLKAEVSSLFCGFQCFQ